MAVQANTILHQREASEGGAGETNRARELKQNKPEQHEGRSGRVEGVHTDNAETAKCHQQLLKKYTSVASASQSNKETASSEIGTWIQLERKTQSRNNKKRTENWTSWMVEARHDAGDLQTKRSCNEEGKQKQFCSHGTQRTSKHLQIFKNKHPRKRVQNRQLNKRTWVQRIQINLESSCARWKPQQANCHEEHVGSHKQCSTFRATWPTEVHPKYLSFFIIFRMYHFLFDFLSSLLFSLISPLLVRIFIVSLFSFFCTFCKSCFSNFLTLFFLFFLFSFSLPPFVNVLRNPLLYLDWSFLFVSISLQKKFCLHKQHDIFLTLPLLQSILTFHQLFCFSSWVFFFLKKSTKKRKQKKTSCVLLINLSLKTAILINLSFFF